MNSLQKEKEDKIGQKHQQQTKTVVNIGRITEDSPFRSSAKVRRSPPREIARPAETSKVAEQREESARRAIEVEETLAETPKVDSLTKLGRKISQLVEFIKTRTNIHKDIHSLTREIQALYLVVSDDIEGLPSKEADKQSVNKETQTEAELNTEATASAGKIGLVTQSHQEVIKKRKTVVDVETIANKKSTAKAASVSQRDENLEGVPNPEWIKVRPKAKKRKKPIRPDALVIRACGVKSYADILKQVKQDPKLSVLGANVKNIRKTEKGELLLQLNKSAHQNTGDFRSAVSDVLGSEAEVRSLTQEVLLEIKDIDEVTTSEEVFEALGRVSEDLKGLQPSIIKSMRKSYGSTQIATVSVSSALASALIQTAKIRIGWVICRIREKISPRRCYRCLNFGHPAARCKSAIDYSSHCIRCGKDGHKIKSCNKEPMCLLCKDSGGDTNHVTGSTFCPQYKSAFQKLRSI